MTNTQKFISALLFSLAILGITGFPVQADEQAATQMTLTLEQTVDLAIKNNLEVQLAGIEKNSTSISYNQALHNQKNTDATDYSTNLTKYLTPKINERKQEEAEKIYEITINGVKTKTENAFYELLKASETEQIAENALQRADEELKITNAKYAAGSATKKAVMQAEATKASAQTTLSSAKNSIWLKNLALNEILGLDMNNQITPSGMFEFSTVNYDLNQLLTTALQENESVIKAQDTYEIAKWTYDFNVSYYTDSNWDSKLAKQDMLSAEIALKQAQNSVVTTVNQAYASYKAYEDQYQYLLKLVDSCKETYRLEWISYEAGLATPTEVASASDDMQQAEASLSECTYNYNTLKSKLKYSIYSN